MMKISSRSNELIKSLKRYHQKKYRDRERRFLAEGVKVIEEALQTGQLVELLLYSSELLRHPRGAALLEAARAVGADLRETEPYVLIDVADTKTPQNVVALIAKPQYELEVLRHNRGIPLVVVLDGLQDPGNVGTIARTADACGLRGLITLQGTVDLFQPKVVRAAAGALFRLPVFADLPAPEVLESLAESGFQLFVANPTGNQSFFDSDFSSPTALFLGNEARGCTELVRQAADRMVFIPMPGRAESLNVGVAAALFIYEAVRQRLKSSLSLP